jgi:hypothetical protein
VQKFSKWAAERLTIRTKEEHYLACLDRVKTMPANPDSSQPSPEPDRLAAATDEAIAACGGNARQAVTALIVVNEFLEAQVRELQTAVPHGYARGKPAPLHLAALVILPPAISAMLPCCESSVTCRTT